MNDCSETLRIALTRYSGGRQFADDTDLFEAGILDSLSFNELLSELERSQGRVFDLDEISDWRALRNFSGLARHLCGHASN